MNELGYAPAGGAVSGVGLLHEDLQPSAGTLLRAAREAAGLHIAALAVSLKVPVKKLEALEQDRTDLLPDNVFARALAASVCRSLKIDPYPVLARLPQGGAAKLKARSPSTPPPFRQPGAASGYVLQLMSARPTVLAGLALVLGSLSVVFWPGLKQIGMRLDVRADATATRDPAAPSEPLILELTGPDDVRIASAAPAGAGDGKSSIPSITPTAPSVFATSAIPTATAGMPVGAKTGDVLSVANAALPSAASGIVTFQAREQSWVEVTDAKGVVVLRRTIAAGEVVGATGALPMAAIVGRADATQVEIRGKPINLGPLSRENVARFEVK